MGFAFCSPAAAPLTSISRAATADAHVQIKYVSPVPPEPNCLETHACKGKPHPGPPGSLQTQVLPSSLTLWGAKQRLCVAHHTTTTKLVDKCQGETNDSKRPVSFPESCKAHKRNEHRQQIPSTRPNTKAHKCAHTLTHYTTH